MHSYLFGSYKKILYIKGTFSHKYPMNKPKRKILGYVMKHQQRGNYKIVEFSELPNGSIKKRSIHKDLDMSTAEQKLYYLENKINN